MFESDRTNVEAIARFTEELEQYESIVKHDSNIFGEFRHPANLLKDAMLRIVGASESDTYEMMRILSKHMIAKLDTAYSEFAILMAAGGNFDLVGTELIMAIAYTTRCVIVGDEYAIDDPWLQIVRNNVAIRHYLHNYHKSDLAIIQKTYSGNLIIAPKKVLFVDDDNRTTTLNVGYNIYELSLNSHHIQTVKFALSDEVKPDPTAQPNKPLVIESEVRISAKVGEFILDESISMLDDAVAQLNALGCSVSGYIPGHPTRVVLPNMFFTCLLIIGSFDSGKSWRVADLQILPPVYRG